MENETHLAVVIKHVTVALAALLHIVTKQALKGWCFFKLIVVATTSSVGVVIRRAIVFGLVIW